MLKCYILSWVQKLHEHPHLRHPKKKMFAVTTALRHVLVGGRVRLRSYPSPFAMTAYGGRCDRLTPLTFASPHFSLLLPLTARPENVPVVGGSLFRGVGRVPSEPRGIV